MAAERDLLAEAQSTLFERIIAAASEEVDPGNLLTLAEALAWVRQPGQDH